MKYLKPAKTIKELSQQLIDRGLIVSNRDSLEHDLKHIGYYRLTGYMYSHQIINGESNDHKFEPNTHYNTIREEYIFDRKLRRLYMEAIEHIEVFCRSIISDHMSIKHGAFWYLDSNHFNHKYSHSKFLVSVKEAMDDSSEKFIRSYKKKYTSEEFPPSWMAFEIISFGMVSKLYDNLAELDKKIIATELGLQPNILKSWLHSLSYIRNISAHHSRLWSKNLTIKIKADNISKNLYTNDNGKFETHKIYAPTVVIVKLLNYVNPANKWLEKLSDIINEHPTLNISPMGFRDDWQEKIKL